MRIIFAGALALALAGCAQPLGQKPVQVSPQTSAAPARLDRSAYVPAAEDQAAIRNRMVESTKNFAFLAAAGYTASLCGLRTDRWYSDLIGILTASMFTQADKEATESGKTYASAYGSGMLRGSLEGADVALRSRRSEVCDILRQGSMLSRLDEVIGVPPAAAGRT